MCSLCVLFLWLFLFIEDCFFFPQSCRVCARCSLICLKVFCFQAQQLPEDHWSMSTEGSSLISIPPLIKQPCLGFTLITRQERKVSPSRPLQLEAVDNDPLWRALLQWEWVFLWVNIFTQLLLVLKEALSSSPRRTKPITCFVQPGVQTNLQYLTVLSRSAENRMSFDSRSASILQGRTHRHDLYIFTIWPAHHLSGSERIRIDWFN